MNFNYVSFESILIIIHEIYMIIVIHPGTWSQHPFVSGFCFFWDALYHVTGPLTNNVRVTQPLHPDNVIV